MRVCADTHTHTHTQLYSRRKGFLKREEEIKKWSEVGPAYMTEESEAEGDTIQ